MAASVVLSNMCGKIAYRDLFPNKTSAIVFVSYILLFVGQGIFITASQSHNSEDGNKTEKYSYNPTSAVLFTETIKLFTAIILFLKDHSLSEGLKTLTDNKAVFAYYLIPSLLFAIYNNLAFHNLATYDPTTYYLLLQLRTGITAIIFQFVFHKKLTSTQWLSLLLLTVGCIVKQSHPPVSPSTTSSSSHMIGISLILVQCLCSCFAGVYNEYLLKDKASTIPLMLQNVCMYANSILVNLIFLLLSSSPTTLSHTFTDDLSSLMRPSVLLVILDNAAIGIVTSLFLAHMNSILKSIASILELNFTALAAWILFDIPINLHSAVALFIVCYAVRLYAVDPVVNRGKLDEESEPSRGSEAVSTPKSDMV